ncbi:MAG: glutamate racemase [Candidatus Omnitrophica bacterium]|nr:glutamate racemase [Candidatus Omnitrophota bacterium]
MDRRPIGIFDSGVGGLTVVDKLLRHLPEENIIYFGDTARVPYGNKSKGTVTRFSKEIVTFLLKFRVKLIIIACNTASSLSLETLKRSFKVPFIGVIDPGVEEALEVTGTGRIGIIGTEATVSSEAYKTKILSVDKNSFVLQKSCPLLVPLVENGWLSNKIAYGIVKEYLSPLLKKNIDTLILGCTHYPLLKNTIKKFVGKGVKLVDSSTAAAKYTYRILDKKGLLARNMKPYVKFFASDDTKKFKKTARIFLKRKIDVKKIIF